MGRVLDEATVGSVAFERVEGRCGGTWVLYGSRMTVRTIVSLFDDGASVGRILDLYPHLTEEQVAASIELPSVVGDERWSRGGPE